MAAFCKEMKKADPSIVLMASYPSEAVVKNAREYIDYICPHHYTADFAAMANSLAECRRLIGEHGGGKAIKVGVTEWNSTAGDAGPKRAMLWNLGNGLHCARYHNFLHRNCDLVEIANRSNLINSFCSGFLQTDRGRLYKTPTYYTQFLYSTRAGAQPLKIVGEPIGAGLDFSATLSSDGRRVVLFLVNYSLRDETLRFDLSAFGDRGRTVQVSTLSDRDRAGEPDVANSFADPQRVAIQESRFVATPTFEYTLRALSLTVLEWRVQAELGG